MAVIENEAESLSISNTTVTKLPKIDKLGRAYGTGRRKVATARVWIKLGTGIMTVNGKEIRSYFNRETSFIHAITPFSVTDTLGKFDVYATISGGGMSGQAGALRHGIARALDNYNPVLYHCKLKEFKLLTRDSRMVESKRYGLHGARRATQFVKR